MEIPTIREVEDSVTDEVFRLRNWTKHRDDPRHRGPYPFADDFDDLDGGRFTRARVFSDFRSSDQKGVISTIKWGYPRGGRPGGVWHSFSDALRSTAHADAVAALRSRLECGDTLIRTLNRVASGVGTATTSKIAYFARLRCGEGGCLIYDSMVRRALKWSADPDICEDDHLLPLRQELLARARDLTPREQEDTYGIYITGLTRSADQRGIEPAQLELALFREGRRVGKVTAKSRHAHRPSQC